MTGWLHGIGPIFRAPMCRDRQLRTHLPKAGEFFERRQWLWGKLGCPQADLDGEPHGSSAKSRTTAGKIRYLRLCLWQAARV